MKTIVLALATICALSISAPAFASCDWGQRSTVAKACRSTDDKANSVRPEQNVYGQARR